MMQQPLIIISGATAVGKTDLSLSLAASIGGEIISADSMQVYKGMDIGTAKITRTEMKGIAHYLIDELDPREEFNVYEFQKRCRTLIPDISSRGKVPILTGGTGFYIQSVLYDIQFTDSETDLTYREELEKIAKTQGPGVLHRMLEEADPAAAQQIHENNIKRVIRALEYYRETGHPISEHNKEQRSRTSSFNYAYFVLNRERSVIYDRINLRVDQMMGQGLVEEVRGLLDQGVPPTALSMQGLGYKEIIRYLQGELSLSEAVSLIKQSTRHFAKRQLTWFRREKDVIWIDYEDFPGPEAMLDHMINIIKEKKIVPLS